MANRYQRLRLTIIDECLRNNGIIWTYKKLQNKIAERMSDKYPDSNVIDQKTLHADMDFIKEEYEIEIEKKTHGRYHSFRYKNPKDSIKNHHFTKNELVTIKDAIMTMSRFNGLPQFKWIFEVIPLLESKIGPLRNEKEIISFDHNPDYPGAVHLLNLYNATLNKKVLNITYKEFSKSSTYDIKLYPHYMKQYNSRWYVLGFTDKEGLNTRPTTLATDRIQEIKELDEEFVDKDFNWNNYFNEMIGMSKFETGPVKVKLLILDKEQADYINTKPLHHTQKINFEKTNGGYELDIEVIHNYELEKLILSFGERVKVISPESLKEKIKKTVLTLHSHYLD